MPALQNFLRDELPRRGWSMKDFAKYAQLSLSNAYLIVRDGDDNVRSDTFENIATGLGMTPAELYMAIGKGRPDDDPELAPLIAAVRQVSKEHRGAVDRMVRAFVSSPEGHPNDSHKGNAQGSRRKNRTRSTQGDSGPDTAPFIWWQRLGHSVAPALQPA